MAPTLGLPQPYFEEKYARPYRPHLSSLSALHENFTSEGNCENLLQTRLLLLRSQLESKANQLRRIRP